MQQNELHHPLPQFKVLLGQLQGLPLTNIHRILLFNQFPWLKNFNTCQCTAAKNNFEKDFFKLMNTAVFGKSFMCLFVLLCSYILIHSLQVNFFSL